VTTDTHTSAGSDIGRQYHLESYRSAFRKAALSVFRPVAAFVIDQAATRITQVEVAELDQSIADLVEYRRRLVAAMR
jgi:hypothetical protein